ncbi:MAG: GntR family transcriptional regulator, partial [Intestinibacter sp.]|uniref:GntR family transcriptional regulator n=1 Tax=Intestinibacter sp. TaxID=1965304 RepID=UPI003F167D7D
LAAEAMVNPNTMQKALAELERQGFVYSKRTSGRFVTDDKALIDRERKNLVKESVKSSLETLINLGYTDEEIIKLIEEILKEGKDE